MNSEIEELKAKLEKVKQKFNTAKTEIQSASNKTYIPPGKYKQVENAEDALRKRHKQWQLQKLAATLKPYCRIEHIKSVGNGL